MWRIHFPLEREYTHDSYAHKSFSRINYVLATDDLLPSMTSPKIHELAISDHAPITITLQLGQKTLQLNTWKFPSQLKDNTDFNNYLNKWTEYETTNSIHADTPVLYWEAAKAYLRGRIISYTGAFKKKTKNPHTQASQELRLAQLEYQSNPGTPTWQKWLCAKSWYDISKKNL